MLLKNATILNANFTLEKADILVENGKIAQIGQNLSHENTVDYSGKTIVPGFIDIHIHGSAGSDTCDGTPEALETISSFLKTKGVTSFCPTTMSIEMDKLYSVMKNIGKCKDAVTGAKIVGVNMEGPYFSPAKAGAQNPDTMHPASSEEVKKCNELCGNILKIVDMCPTLEGSFDFISENKDKYALSIAHTAADYDCAKDAFSAGMRHTTHLYNAMSPFTHRDPGVVGAVYDSNATAELICDGIHIHESVIRTTFKIMSERLVLISDSMAAGGMPDGEYELGGAPVIVKDGAARILSGALAGSTANMHQCVKNCIDFGISLETAVKSATLIPAKVIGLENEVGSIEVGKKADLVVLDKDFAIVDTYINGAL